MTISIQDMTTADMPIHMKMDVPAMNAGTKLKIKTLQYPHISRMGHVLFPPSIIHVWMQRRWG